MRTILWFPLAASTVLLGALVCNALLAEDVQPPKEFAPIEDDHLHNAHRISDNLVSGAQPEGEAAFAALKKLEIKTIISVDGAKPDVELASKYGLRYVHLPFGYDGVPEAQGLAIAKALRELDGPIYLHCHHGKHRSAAAVAVGCVLNGDLKPEQADAVLQTFGTGENYKGLWADARSARPLTDAQLAAVKVDYVESAKIPPIADAMVQVDQTWDRLKASAAAGWNAPADIPDLDPAHEALQLLEHFVEMGRTEDVKSRPDGFRQLMTASERDAAGLEIALRAWRAAGQPSPAPETVTKPFAALGASCKTCHADFRN